MSAIAVLWNTQPGPPVTFPLQRMMQRLQQYGPQASDTWTGDDRTIGLGRTLSHRVPQDLLDRQPLWSSDGECCLVADVRLDEPVALAQLLGLSPGLSDSAILLAAWERWGEQCVRHLLGAFAFAVWSPRRQELFAARDGTSERPLFFTRGPGIFALASMPKALRALPGVGTGIDEAWVANWLVTTIPNDRTTLFTGIERLLPGQTLRVTPASFQVETYWTPFSAPPIRFKRNSDYAEGLVEVLDRATASRLRRVGGIGCMLSSGLDSSSVMASAATLLGPAGVPLRAYTSVPRAGFSAESYSKRPVVDEGPFAAQAAALYPNVTYAPFTTEGIPLVPSIAAFSDAMDEPFLNGFNALWYTGIFADAHRRGIGVLLQGAIGNATISFESLNVGAHWLRTGHWFRLLRHLYTLRREGEMSVRNASRAILQLAQPKSLSHRRWRREGVTFDHGESLIHPRFVREQRLAEKALATRLATGNGYHTERMNFYHIADFSRIHAALESLFGVDSRDPTNDRRVWEYTHSIPREQFAIDGHTRSLVRRAMRGRLPDSTLDRYRQGRQGADWYMTMREQLPALREEVRLIAECAPAQHMLDIPRMQWLLDNFPTDGYGTIHVMNTWKYSFTRALSLGNYLRRHS